VAFSGNRFWPTCNKYVPGITGFWTLYIARYSKEHVSETGSVSVLMWRGGGTPTLLGPVERANLNHWNQQSSCLPLLHLRTETDPVSETLCPLVFFRIPDDGQSPKTQ
jgi:hypothetical protein